MDIRLVSITGKSSEKVGFAPADDRAETFRVLKKAAQTYLGRGCQIDYSTLTATCPQGWKIIIV